MFNIFNNTITSKSFLKRALQFFSLLQTSFKKKVKLALMLKLQYKFLIIGIYYKAQ